MDGKVVGVLFPNGENGLKLVSAHIGEQNVEEGFAGEIIEDDGSASWPPIPAILVQFSPSPYQIVGRRIVRLETEPDEQ